MENVKKILDGLLQPSNQEDSWKINLIKNWPNIIGSLHEKISLHKINAKTIVVGVYDSSWTQELYLLSKLILHKINSSLDRPRIESLRFQCIEKITHQSKKKHRQVYKNIFIKKPLKTEQRNALQKIQDPQLAQALQDFLQKCQQD